MSSGTRRAGAVKRAEQVAEAIETRIAETGWPIGELIGSEQELTAEFDVSRGVLREAVRLLEHHGTARMRRGPGGGLFVTAPSLHALRRSATLYLRYARVDIGALSAARRILELNVLDLVGARISEPSVQDRLSRALALEAEHVQHRSPSTPEAILHNFHHELADLAANPTVSLFTAIITQVQTEFANEMRDRQGGTYVRPLETNASSDAHRAIYDALIDGDIELAKGHMGHHLDELARFGSSSPAAEDTSGISRSLR